MKPQADGAVKVGIDVRVPSSDVDNQGFGGIEVTVQVLGDRASCCAETVCIQEALNALLTTARLQPGKV